MSASGFGKALVVTPHPDDAEIVAGGTVARWASGGTEVVLCVVTNGALGSNDPSTQRENLIQTREQEQLEAASILGISDVIFLRHEDGHVEDSHELRCDLIREIRRHKPDVVVGVDPSTYYVGQWYVNHPDHRRTGEALLAAVNPGATTVPLYRPHLFDQGFQPHHVGTCLLGATVAPDYFVGIDDFIQVKLKALKAHRSQMAGWDAMEGVVTALAEGTAADSGLACRYAEGYKAVYLHGPGAAMDHDAADLARQTAGHYSPSARGGAGGG